MRSVNNEIAITENSRTSELSLALFEILSQEKINIITKKRKDKIIAVWFVKIANKKKKKLIVAYFVFCNLIYLKYASNPAYIKVTANNGSLCERERKIEAGEYK